MDKTSILFSISLTEQFEKLWGQFGAKTKKSPSQISERAIKVIRLGFEPKTHSLEGCCSIQLSYRTDPLCFRVGAEVEIYSLEGCRSVGIP